MTFLFRTPKLPPVPPPEPTPEVTAEDDSAINERLRRQQRSSKGRRSTMLTGGLGIQNTAAVKRQTLGGY